MSYYINYEMDKIVRSSHGHRIMGAEYHPYHVASDLAALVAIAWYFLFTFHFHKIGFWSSTFSFLATLILYRLFLIFKARVFGSHSRSFIQDSIYFVLPVYGLINFLLGNDLASAFDALGIALPLYVGIVRIGCFLSGCCYGVPSNYGVLYPSSIFRSVRGCRQYTPGLDPRQRVFPIQLVESACLLSLASILSVWLFSKTTPHGYALPVFLLIYGAIRFFLDFFRGSSARPKVGNFSEAQVYCLAIIVVSGFIVFWLSVKDR